MFKRWMKLCYLGLSGLILIAVFQNCGPVPSFSGYRPGASCDENGCSADFSSQSTGTPNAPPEALKNIPSDIARTLMINTDCYNLLFSKTKANSQLLPETLSASQYFGSIKKLGTGNVILNISSMYGDLIVDGADQFSATGATAHHGSLCVRAEKLGNMTVDEIQGSDAILSFVAMSEAQNIQGGAFYGINVFVPVVVYGANMQTLSAAKFHKDQYIFNSNIDLIQGDTMDIHLYGTSHVKQLNGANLGKVYLHDSASIGTVSTSGSGGQIVDCSLPGALCPSVPPPDIPLPPSF